VETLPGETVRTEGDPPSTDQSTDQAYDGLGSGYALFWQAYGRDSIDGANLPLEATVHYGTAYDNAFWNGSRMVFGDGDGEVFRGFTGSLSVIGHELAHGVTERTAGLAYQGQSGALNEHISDVFGALTEQHSSDQGAGQASWLIGSEIFTPAVQGRALRDMHNPGTAYDDDVLGSDPQPAHMRGYITTLEDNGGVHLNSGIPNRAFTLAALAIGGAAWNGAGLIWYRALTSGGIEPDAGFERFARATLDAAAGLFGPGSAEQRAVRAGWIEVGVLTATEGAGR
ncbi:M4 family metallopeptidase, partial [Microterricola pindariensis]